MSLLYKNEKPLFNIMLGISLLAWVGLAVGTMGMVLIYVVFFALFYVLAQSGFISYLKGTAVEITPEQFPDLHQKISDACDTLGLAQVPSAYLMHMGGAFNALATRFLGKNFIVLYSDVVDALEEHPDALNFYIGHEVGHLKRKHLLWGPLLAPASFLPILGTAYSRAKEYSCDRHGLAVCADPASAQLGLAALAAGGKRWRTMNQEHYIAQAKQSSGFWMSLYELISDYPWLTKRIAALRGLANGQESRQPRRHWLAWFFALFIPRFGFAGAASGMLVVAMIGILAAIALPAYQEYVNKAAVAQAVMEGGKAAAVVQKYYEQTQKLPASLQQVGYALAESVPSVASVDFNRDEAIVVITMATKAFDGQTIELVPKLDANKRIHWKCVSDKVSPTLLPQSCK